MSSNLITVIKLVKIFILFALFLYKHSVFVGQAQHAYYFSNFRLILYAYNILNIIESVVTVMN